MEELIKVIPWGELLTGFVVVIGAMILGRYRLNEVEKDIDELEIARACSSKELHSKIESLRDENQKELHSKAEHLRVESVEELRKVKDELQVLHLKISEFEKVQLRDYVPKEEWRRSMEKIDQKLDRLFEIMTKEGNAKV